jgi:tripeptide aminopeptidase
MAADQNVSAAPIPSNCRALIRKRVLERLRYYVTIDTRSDPQIRRHPSSDGQWDLARILRAELDDMDGVRAALDDQCYLYAPLYAQPVALSL